MTISVHSDAPERGEVPLRQRRPRAAATTEFGAALTTLGLPQNRVAKLFGVSCRHIRRWQHGNRTVPRAVRLVINLLVAGAISIDQVEAAAQTNGVKPALPARLRDEPEPKPPTPCLVEPAPAPAALTPVKINGAAGPVGAPAPRLPAPAALARTEAATLADPGFTTTAMTIYALGPKSCRWPHGDPGRPGFGFCGRATVREPYCEHHCTLAYAARSLPPSATLAGALASAGGRERTSP